MWNSFGSELNQNIKLKFWVGYWVTIIAASWWVCWTICRLYQGDIRNLIRSLLNYLIHWRYKIIERDRAICEDFFFWKSTVLCILSPTEERDIDDGYLLCWKAKERGFLRSTHNAYCIVLCSWVYTLGYCLGSSDGSKDGSLHCFGSRLKEHGCWAKLICPPKLVRTQGKWIFPLGKMRVTWEKQTALEPS